MQVFIRNFRQYPPYYTYMYVGFRVRSEIQPLQRHARNGKAHSSSALIRRYLHSLESFSQRSHAQSRLIGDYAIPHNITILDSKVLQADGPPANPKPFRQPEGHPRPSFGRALPESVLAIQVRPLQPRHRRNGTGKAVSRAAGGLGDAVNAQLSLQLCGSATHRNACDL